MSTPPNTQNFSAWINLQPPGPSKLIVIGEVETPSSADIPVLTETDDPRNPSTTLELDLTIRNTGGIGTPAIEFQPVRFEKSASAGQYEKVLILWQGSIINSADVGEAN